MRARVIALYTTIGFLFGASFPIIASLWLMRQGGFTLSLENFLIVQQHHPLTWMIDLAPLALSGAAALAGVFQARSILLNQQLEERIHQQEALTAELQELRKRLEEHLEKQLVELKAAAQVARAAIGIHDLERLLDDTVNLISDQFGFYHAGIFLIDDAGEYAVLKAASSEGGKRMLARGHKLMVGKMGIVGHVAGKGEARIALDVGSDAVFFDNPDLPQTHSEMAVPLIARGAVIGVLDVQSTQADAFSEEDVAILQTLADQVALAIDNARLFSQSREALRELETLNRRLVSQAWQPRLRSGHLSYAYDPLGVHPLENKEDVQVAEESHIKLSLPISFRGQKLGSLTLWRSNDQPPWSPQEVELMHTIVTQLGLALENARALEDRQRQAEREHLVAEITSRLWASADIHTILRTAVEELGRKLDVADVRLQLEAPTMEPALPTQNEAML